jgi:hypothetical protein
MIQMATDRRLWSSQHTLSNGRQVAVRAFFRLFRQVFSILAILLALSYGSILAQTSPTATPTVTFRHDAKNVTGFAVYATRREDGATRRLQIEVPRREENGEFRVTLPPLEPGTWRIAIAAYNAAGESPRVPTDPPELRIEGQSPQKKAKEPPPPKPKVAPKSPSSQPSSSKPKGGFLGKVWRVIVGQ